MRRRYLQLIAAVPIAVIALTPALIIGQQSPRQIFERAKIVEEANTDLMQAIHLYEQVVAQSKDRVLTAEALLHIGGSYEKLGSAESRKAYERVALEFADQKAVAADAGRRLAVLNIPLNLNQPTTRLVLAGDSVDSDASLSPDGRWMAMSDWSSKDGHLVVGICPPARSSDSRRQHATSVPMTVRLRKKLSFRQIHARSRSSGMTTWKSTATLSCGSLQTRLAPNHEFWSAVWKTTFGPQPGHTTENPFSERSGSLT